MIVTIILVLNFEEKKPVRENYAQAFIIFLNLIEFHLDFFKVIFFFFGDDAFPEFFELADEMRKRIKQREKNVLECWRFFLYIYLILHFINSKITSFEIIIKKILRVCYIS